MTDCVVLRKTQFSDVAQKCSQDFRLSKFLVEVIPVLGWLPKYNWKNDLVKDIISGITVAIMHIPQGKYRIQKNWATKIAENFKDS